MHKPVDVDFEFINEWVSKIANNLFFRLRRLVAGVFGFDTRTVVVSVILDLRCAAI